MLVIWKKVESLWTKSVTLSSSFPPYVLSNKCADVWSTAMLLQWDNRKTYKAAKLSILPGWCEEKSCTDIFWAGLPVQKKVKLYSPGWILCDPRLHPNPQQTAVYLHVSPPKWPKLGVLVKCATVWVSTQFSTIVIIKNKNKKCSGDVDYRLCLPEVPGHSHCSVTLTRLQSIDCCLLLPLYNSIYFIHQQVTSYSRFTSRILTDFPKVENATYFFKI